MARRGGGRDARRAVRTDTSAVAGFGALERKIPYLDLLSPEQVDRIHDESMKLLAEVGIEFRDDEAIEMWQAHGTKTDGYRVHFDRDELMALIAQAPETYTMTARDRSKSVVVGGRSTVFTPSYGAPFVLDVDGTRRHSTLDDFHNFAKIYHQEPALASLGGVLVEPMDVPVPHRHLEMTASLLRHSDKPFMGSVTSRERAEESLHMIGIVFGQDFVRDNTVVTSLANCNSPLVWDQTMLDAVKVYAGSNQAMLFSPFVLGGASTPASTVASVIQLNAETLAGVAFAQLVRPGAPALYGQWLSTVAMNSGAPQAGMPEIDHMNLLCGQMARHYKLPWRCSGGCSSSKLTDAQAGYEAARNMYGVVLAGANYVLSTTGYLESAMCQSYSKAILDGEQLQMFYRLAGGVDFDDLDGALEAMREVEPGGHFLETAHTLNNFQDAFMMPSTMNADGYEQWLAEGGLDADQRAGKKVAEKLDAYVEPKLDDGIEAELADFVARRRSEIPEGRL